MEKSFNNMKDEEVINMYHILISELKERNIIRTKNIVGDLGEYIAINWYNEHKELPKLKLQKNLVMLKTIQVYYKRQVDKINIYY